MKCCRICSAQSKKKISMTRAYTYTEGEIGFASVASPRPQRAGNSEDKMHLADCGVKKKYQALHVTCRMFMDIVCWVIGSNLDSSNGLFHRTMERKYGYGKVVEFSHWKLNYIGSTSIILQVWKSSWEIRVLSYLQIKYDWFIFAYANSWIWSKIQNIQFKTFMINLA